MGNRPPCSSVARALGEEQVGTASRYRFWLLIEQPGPWGHDALVESGFPPDVGLALRAAGHRLGIRVLLIKRRDRTPGVPRRCFAAFTGRRDRRLSTFEVDDPAELLDLDLPALVRDRYRGLGEPATGPLFLVCTHGKHDPCCARHGAPLFRAVEDREDTWEATHVGGDRFAGNVVSFPHGLYFGRVTPSDAPEVLDAYARGEIVLELYRGRSSYAPAVQVAEHHIRRAGGLKGVDDLMLTGYRRRGSVHEVRFASAAAAHRIALEETASHERPLTCKATQPHRPRRFEVISMSEEV
jgi:hypothetical protein